MFRDETDYSESTAILYDVLVEDRAIATALPYGEALRLAQRTKLARTQRASNPVSPIHGSQEDHIMSDSTIPAPLNWDDDPSPAVGDVHYCDHCDIGQSAAILICPDCEHPTGADDMSLVDRERSPQDTSPAPVDPIARDYTPGPGSVPVSLVPPGEDPGMIARKADRTATFTRGPREGNGFTRRTRDN